MNVCRACLVTKETFSHFLFKNVSIDTFVFCTSIQVEENDQLPRSICNSCYELLDKFYNFKKTCLESQRTLLGLQDSLKSENEGSFEVFENDVQYEDIKVERGIESDKELNYEDDNNFSEDLLQGDDISLDVMVIPSSKKEERGIESEEEFNNEEDYEFSEDLLQENGRSKDDITFKSNRHVQIKGGELNILENEDIPKIKRPSFNLLCSICNKEKFKHELALEAHKLICEGKVSEITCPRCYKTFTNWKKLLGHMKDDHIKHSFKCPTCGKKCKTKATLKNHIETQHEGKTELYICDVCGKQFADRTVLKTHLQIHNVIAKQLRKRQKFSCKVENEEKFHNDVDNAGKDLSENLTHDNDQVKKTNIKLKRGKIKTSEINEETKVKRAPYDISCRICKKRFKHELALEAHKLMCEGKVTAITCPKCFRTFSSWSNLLRHMTDEHTNVNMALLKCPTCGKVYKTQMTLRNHINKLHRAVKKELYVCDVCGKHLANVNVLKKHLEIHDENRQRNFSCDKCDKKFLTKNSLRIHVTVVHEGQRFICHVCSYPFTHRSGLIDHLQSHDGVKKFKCDICEKSFAKSGTLVIHKRTHSGEKPYPCSFCQKCFISTTRLTAHVRTHTGERPYVCSVCSQTYTARMSLKRHMKVHNKVPVLV